MTDILSLIEADGHTPKKTATTQGGEYSSPCPSCGGKDRFHIWPEKGRYWCRGCGKSGDAIQYLRDFRGMNYVEACSFLGESPKELTATPTHRPEAWTPKDPITPPEAWQERARAFLDRAINTLWSDQGAPVRQWLKREKGLQDATIKKAWLGFAPSEKYEPRASWGLPETIREDGKAKDVWLPAGIVIPHLQGDHIQRLRIRRDNPGDGSRYIVVSCSSSRPMVQGDHGRAAAVIVESELDGLLISQEVGDLVMAVAMGSATNRPDRETHDLLRSTPLILLAMDSDEPGAKAAWQFWPATYPQVKRWPVVGGKDPSDAWQKGMSIRNWITAGMFPTLEAFERFSIMTIDGHMPDNEAMRQIQKGR